MLEAAFPLLVTLDRIRTGRRARIAIEVGVIAGVQLPGIIHEILGIAGGSLDLGGGLGSSPRRSATGSRRAVVQAGRVA